MDSRKIIEALGGHAAVVGITGLSKGRISQWATQNKIPRPWMLMFRAKFPDIKWDDDCVEVSMKDGM